METIKSLMEEEKTFPVDAINYPNGILKLEGIEIGYTLPCVHGHTLQFLLNSKLPFETKIYYLKEIGKVLEKMDEVRRETFFKDFFINDLHEKNVMFDENGQIKIIDVDSFSILGNEVSRSMYLRPFSRLDELSKYKKGEKSFLGKQIVPTYDTEVFCYCTIILNFLYGDKISFLNVEEFYNYLNYLEEIGVNKELIAIFRRLYEDKYNVNPMDLLDELPNTPLTRKKYYEKTRRF